MLEVTPRFVRERPLVLSVLENGLPPSFCCGWTAPPPYLVLQRCRRSGENNRAHKQGSGSRMGRFHPLMGAVPLYGSLLAGNDDPWCKLVSSVLPFLTISLVVVKLVV